MLRDVQSYKESDWVVFISHAGMDAWVAKKIADEVIACGAVPFLDESDIDIGEDFEEYILGALANAKELVVLLTPWSLKRPYVWAEIGAAWGRRIPIVGILHGLTAADLQADTSVPVILKRRNLISLNEVDEYLMELKGRVALRSTEGEA
ncbi:MAG TPA: toll/interleukin-1 receptor domain-containing protein [Chloroflexia bacterium]|jgi:hypothetical protein